MARAVATTRATEWSQVASHLERRENEMSALYSRYILASIPPVDPAMELIRFDCHFLDSANCSRLVVFRDVMDVVDRTVDAVGV